MISESESESELLLVTRLSISSYGIHPQMSITRRAPRNMR